MNQLLSKTNRRKLSHFLSAWGAVISMIVAFVIFSILQPSFFFTLNNVENILRAASITVVIAMGTTFAFSCNVFDLSVGALATLGAAFSLTFMVWYGIPLPLAILLTVVCCMAFGAINAILVLKFKIPAILTTLAMQFIMSGLALTYSGGSVINPNRPGANGQEIVMEVPELFWKLGKAPWIYIIMLASVAVVAIFQNYTKHGRYLYMVGANPEAAKLAGINVTAYRTLAFVVTGVFAALGNPDCGPGRYCGGQRRRILPDARYGGCQHRYCRGRRGQAQRHRHPHWRAAHPGGGKRPVYAERALLFY